MANTASVTTLVQENSHSRWSSFWGLRHTHVGGDGIITFDRLASRWVIGVRAIPTPHHFYYCVAISNTDNLASTRLVWHTYEFALNPVLGVNKRGTPYFPDWPKLGTWPDAYYVSMDLNDVDQNYLQIGVVVCALDRNKMLIGAKPRALQCFSDPRHIPVDGSLYLKHSLIHLTLKAPLRPRLVDTSTS